VSNTGTTISERVDLEQEEGFDYNISTAHSIAHVPTAVPEPLLRLPHRSRFIRQPGEVSRFLRLSCRLYEREV
jgi:hypothetical protein